MTCLRSLAKNVLYSFCTHLFNVIIYNLYIIKYSAWLVSSLEEKLCAVMKEAKRKKPIIAPLRIRERCAVHKRLTEVL